MYDLVLPIGERCHTKEALKSVLSDFPLYIFDYLGGVSLSIIKNTLSNNFNTFLLKENIDFINNGDGKHYYTVDRTTDIRISHIFKCNLDEKASLESFYPLIPRLINKTKTMIEQSSRILMIHCNDEFTYNLEEIKSFSKDIRTLYPKKKIDFLFCLYNNINDVLCYYKKNGITIYIIPIHKQKQQAPSNLEIWSNMEALTKCLKEYFCVSNNDIITYATIKRRYYFFKLLSKITFGKLRKHYKKKRKELKSKLKQVRKFLKGK